MWIRKYYNAQYALIANLEKRRVALVIWWGSFLMDQTMDLFYSMRCFVTFWEFSLFLMHSNSHKFEIMIGSACFPIFSFTNHTNLHAEIILTRITLITIRKRKILLRYVRDNYFILLHCCANDNKRIMAQLTHTC